MPLCPELTSADTRLAANALIGWVESLGILVAGVDTGAFGTVGGVVAVAALLLGTAAALLPPLRKLALERRSICHAGIADPRAGPSRQWQSRPARLLVGLPGAEYVVIGALDVLFVVMAIDMLHAGPA